MVWEGGTDGRGGGREDERERGGRGEGGKGGEGRRGGGRSLRQWWAVLLALGATHTPYHPHPPHPPHTHPTRHPPPAPAPPWQALYRLYRHTQDPEHRRFGQLFVKPAFWESVLAGRDVLPSLHANTHLAQVVGFAEEFEATGSADARTAVQNFFDIVTEHHRWALRGSWAWAWAPTGLQSFSIIMKFWVGVWGWSML